MLQVYRLRQRGLYISGAGGSNHLSTPTVDTELACYQLCRGNPDCSAFTYYWQGTHMSGTCQLKKDLINPAGLMRILPSDLNSITTGEQKAAPFVNGQQSGQNMYIGRGY